MPFIDSSNALWNSLLKTLPYDIYQLPDYCDLEAKTLRGKPFAWVKEEPDAILLIPFIERKIGEVDNQYDLVSPYGYPGIIHSPNISSDIITNAFITFHQEAAEHGYVSSLIRLHPFYNNFYFKNLENIYQKTHGLCVSINLQESMNNIRNGYSRNHKRNLHQLKKNLFTAQINNWNFLDEFISLYTETMNRKKVQERYFFSKEYFNKLRDIAQTNLILITIYDRHGVMASGGLFTLFHNLAQYHLGGTATRFIKDSPSKLMIDVAIEHCKQSGANKLHLGGGFGASDNDGLFRFKSGFGLELKRFSTLRFIHLPEIYSQLIHKIQKTHNTLASPFFPAYRL